MCIKFPRQVLFVFFFLSFINTPLYARKDVRPALYKQIQAYCYKNATLKMPKKKIRQVCKCLVEEHQKKDLDLESLKTIHKIYSRSKKIKPKISSADQKVIVAYDDDTARDCISKYK